jgi:hypothetical protein
MRRALLVVVTLGALIFAPAAFAQDDNPTGDDLGGDDRGASGASTIIPAGTTISERTMTARSAPPPSTITPQAT